MVIAIALVAILAVVGVSVRDRYFNPDWNIEDDLYGNVFPSVIVSTAMTDKQTIVKNDTNVLGNSKNPFAIRIYNKIINNRIRIEIEESEFFYRSVFEVMVPEMNKTYIIYPDIPWKYEALKRNRQSRPFTLNVSLHSGAVAKSYKSRTLSMRSINECLLGYKDLKSDYHSTSYFYAAYVNEEDPVIDEILREALETKIVRNFVGYQFNRPERVKKEVFAIWYALQKRGFKYSSLTNTSLSSQSLFTQRVRMIDDSFRAHQLNCVDGCVLMASILKGVGIDPILVRIPGHMFLGFYLDRQHKRVAFLETTAIGGVDVVNKEKELGVLQTQNLSLTRFNAAMDAGNKKFADNEKHFKERKNPNYMFLEINKNVRRVVQPIGQ